MKNKLLLSLWIAGGLLYAGGTIFLANAILGAGTRNVAIVADKVTTTPQPMQLAQCDPAPAAAADPAKPAQDQAKSAAGAVEPSATPAQEPVKTAALPAGSADGADQAADGDSVPQLPTVDAAAPQTEDAASPDGEDRSEAAAPDANPDQAQGAWIVAATADVHAQPSAEAPSIYSLPAGRQVRVLARDNGWAQVQDVASGGTGWVDAQVLAPVGRGYGNGNGYDDANAEDPDGQEDWRWRRRHRPGFFGDFVRRALGGW